MDDKLLRELHAQHMHGPQSYVGDLCIRAKYEIKRLQALVAFYEGQNKQSNEIRNATLWLDYQSSPPIVDIEETRK